MLTSEQDRVQFDKFITSSARATSLRDIEPRQFVYENNSSQLLDITLPGMQAFSPQASKDSHPHISVDITGQTISFSHGPSALETSFTTSLSLPETAITLGHNSDPIPDTQNYSAPHITLVKTFATRVTKGRVPAGTSLRNKRTCYTCAMAKCPGIAHRPACAGWKGEKCGDDCKKCQSA